MGFVSGQPAPSSIHLLIAAISSLVRRSPSGGIRSSSSSGRETLRISSLSLASPATIVGNSRSPKTT